jgi:antitoxin component of RelBE/YafQ-DinJ toxin-antitoxin module
MKTTLNIKINKRIKEKAQKLAKGFGISLKSIAIQYVKNFIYKGENKILKS